MLVSPLQTPVSDVGRGPQPAPAPVSWELEFRFLDPRPIEVQLPGADRPEVYWYIVYTVVNRGPRSQWFFPMFQIVTEDLRVYDTDMGISPLVFDAIRERHKITHKYLEEPTKVIGALLSGEDNARESVAIWRAVDLTVNNFSIYVSGLSGEIQFLPNPAYDPSRPQSASPTQASDQPGRKDPNTKFFTLRKTLEVRYNAPGSPQARQAVLPQRSEVRWIMR